MTRLLNGRITQRCLCPEAMYWNVGEMVLIGKGERAALFLVVARLSTVAVGMQYKREFLGGAHAQNGAAERVPSRPWFRSPAGESPVRSRDGQKDEAKGSTGLPEVQR